MPYNVIHVPRYLILWFVYVCAAYTNHIRNDQLKTHLAWRINTKRVSDSMHENPGKESKVRDKGTNRNKALNSC